MMEYCPYSDCDCYTNGGKCTNKCRCKYLDEELSFSQFSCKCKKYCQNNGSCICTRSGIGCNINCNCTYKEYELHKEL